MAVRLRYDAGRMRRWHRAIPPAIVALVFAAHFGGIITSYDSRWSIPTARSIVREGNADLEEYRARAEADPGSLYALDTVGGGQLPELMAAAEAGNVEPRQSRPGEGQGGPLLFEQVNAPKVMSPWEMRCHLAFLVDETVPDPLLPRVVDCVERFIDDWAAAWAQFGTDDAGLPAYGHLIAKVRQDLSKLGGDKIALRNRWPLYHMLDQMIFQMARPRLSNQQPQAGSLASAVQQTAYAASQVTG